MANTLGRATKGLVKSLSGIALGAAAISASGCVTSDVAAGAGNSFGLREPTPIEAVNYGDYLAAQYAWLSSDPDTASSRYLRSLKRTRDHDSVLEKAVFASLLANDFELAAKTAKVSRKTEVGAAPLTRLTTAIDAFNNRDYDKAQSLLAEADLGLFNSILADSVIAWSLAGQGDTEAAIDVLARQSPGGPFIDRLNLFAQGFVQLNAGEENEALEAFQKAIDDNMGLHVAAEAQARLLASRGDEAGARKTIAFIRSELGAHPIIRDLEKRLDAGEKIDAPRPDLRQGLAMSIFGPIAALAVRSGGGLSSIAYLELVQAIDPEQHSATLMMARMLEAEGRKDDAAEILQRVSDASPYAAAARLQRAWLLLRSEQDEAALASAMSAVELDGGRAVNMELGEFFLALEDYEAGEEIMARLLATDAEVGVEDWRVLFVLGAARHQLDKWEEAEANLLRALELNEDSPDILNYLGYSWVDRGENIDEGFRLIKRAVRLRPNAGFIVDSLGWAYYRLGRYEEAVFHLERAVELSPDDPEINDHLGDAYWRSGKHDLARYQWERVSLFEPSDKILQDVASKLEEGLPDEIIVDHKEPGDSGDVKDANSKQTRL